MVHSNFSNNPKKIMRLFLVVFMKMAKPSCSDCSNEYKENVTYPGRNNFFTRFYSWRWFERNLTRHYTNPHFFIRYYERNWRTFHCSPEYQRGLDQSEIRNFAVDWWISEHVPHQKLTETIFRSPDGVFLLTTWLRYLVFLYAAFTASTKTGLSKMSL